jgi:hypothetical protein
MRPPADFVERLLAGQSYQAIADDYNVHRVTIYGWADQPDVKEEIAALRRERHARSLQQLEALQAPALTAMTELLIDAGPLICARCKLGVAICSDCGKPIETPTTPAAVRAKVSEMVLDRTGLPKTEITEHAGTVTTTTPGEGDAADIMSAAADIAADEGEHILAQLSRALAVRLRAKTTKEKSA